MRSATENKTNTHAGKRRNNNPNPLPAVVEEDIPVIVHESEDNPDVDDCLVHQRARVQYRMMRRSCVPQYSTGCNHPPHRVLRIAMTKLTDRQKKMSHARVGVGVAHFQFPLSFNPFPRSY